jgi:hypothetical protein
VPIIYSTLPQKLVVSASKVVLYIYIYKKNTKKQKKVSTTLVARKENYEMLNSLNFFFFNPRCPDQLTHTTTNFRTHFYLRLIQLYLFIQKNIYKNQVTQIEFLHWLPYYNMLSKKDSWIVRKFLLHCNLTLNSNLLMISAI